MSEMEMKYGYSSNADSALRDEIMSCGDKFFMMSSDRTAVRAERERFLHALLGARSFRA